MSRTAHESHADGALLVAIGFVVAVGSVLWLWGGVAGLAFGSGWPTVHVGDLLGVLVRLPSHVSDPARAWPVTTRSGLPGPGGFYAALALLATAAGLAATVVARLGAPPLRRVTADGAKWARSGELRALRRHGPSRRSGRLALGRHRGRLLRTEQRHALVAFGPPQSGKSAGVAVPALLEWEGAAVASSIKTDLLGATLSRRK
jgi:type IV secretion system protein VirD4